MLCVLANLCRRVMVAFVLPAAHPRFIVNWSRDDFFAPCCHVVIAAAHAWLFVNEFARCCFALSGCGSRWSLLGVKGSHPMLSLLRSSRGLNTENAMW